MSSDSGEGTQVASSQPSESRRPVYRVESTGNFWHDAREAFKVRLRQVLTLMQLNTLRS